MYIYIQGIGQPTYISIIFWLFNVPKSKMQTRYCIPTGFTVSIYLYSDLIVGMNYIFPSFSCSIYPSLSFSLCVYACVFVCMCVCMFMHVCVLVYVYAHILVIFICSCMRICICYILHICVFLYVLCINMLLYVCPCVCVHKCKYYCVYASFMFFLFFYLRV